MNDIFSRIEVRRGSTFQVRSEMRAAPVGNAPFWCATYGYVNMTFQVVSLRNTWHTSFVHTPPALPTGYHTDECPYCNHRPLDFFAETAVNTSLFRFLQDLTLILPDGKRVSFAETQAADAGTEAKK